MMNREIDWKDSPERKSRSRVKKCSKHERSYTSSSSSSSSSSESSPTPVKKRRSSSSRSKSRSRSKHRSRSRQKGALDQNHVHLPTINKCGHAG